MPDGERINYDPSSDRAAGILKRGYYRDQKYKLETDLRLLSSKYLGRSVGLYLEAGPIDEHRATAPVVEAIRNLLSQAGINVLSLNEEAAQAFLETQEWDDAILGGQQADLIVIGSCYSRKGKPKYHHLIMSANLAGGFSFVREWGDFQYYQLREAAGAFEAYHLLALRGAVRILELLEVAVCHVERPEEICVPNRVVTDY